MAIPIFDSLLEVADTVLEKVIPDKNQRDRLSHEMATMGSRNAHDIMMAQIELNAVEAKSDKWWKAGWRPAVGWVCVGAMINNFLLLPYMALLSDNIVPMDWAALSPILLGMLGLGTMRTVEKVKRRN